MWQEEGYPIHSVVPSKHDYCICESWLSQGYEIKTLHLTEGHIVFRRTENYKSSLIVPKALTKQKLPDAAIYEGNKFFSYITKKIQPLDDGPPWVKLLLSPPARMCGNERPKGAKKPRRQVCSTAREMVRPGVWEHPTRAWEYPFGYSHALLAFSINHAGKPPQKSAPPGYNIGITLTGGLDYE